MNTVKIIPPQRYRAIIAGPMGAAATALAHWTDSSRPLADVWVNGYGAVHATIYADARQLSRWFSATHDRGPGALLCYLIPT
jgi:hypothetical protein